MKKISALLLAGVMAATALAGCGGSNSTTAKGSSETENDWTYIQNKGEFVIGITYFEPMNYMDENGNLTGFETEFATKVCEKMGVTPKFQKIDWDSKDMELNSGTISCIWNGFTMNGREDQYTWTDPYMDNSQVVVVKKDSGINTLADLAGKVVEVQKESAAETALNDEEHADLTASFAQLLSVGEYNTAFMDLESGAVDAVAIDIGVAQFQIEGKEDQYQILDETISSEQYAVGFFLGNTALRDEVQSTLLEMVEDGTFAEISNKYFGYDVCTLGK